MKYSRKAFAVGFSKFSYRPPYSAASERAQQKPEWSGRSRAQKRGILAIGVSRPRLHVYARDAPTTKAEICIAGGSFWH